MLNLDKFKNHFLSLRRFFLFSFPFVFLLLQISCTGVSAEKSNVNFVVKSNYVKIDSKGRALSAQSFGPQSSFFLNGEEGEQLSSDHIFDPSEYCFSVNVLGDRIDNSGFPVEGGDVCTDTMRVPFLGIGKLSNFFEINESSPTGTVDFELTHGNRTFDLIALKKTAFSDGTCPIGSVEIKPKEGSEDEPVMLVDGLPYDAFKGSGESDEGSGDEDSSPVIFARENVFISANVQNDINLVVNKVDLESTNAGMWIGKEWGCERGGGNHPQIAFEKRIFKAADIGEEYAPKMKNVDYCELWKDSHKIAGENAETVLANALPIKMSDTSTCTISIVNKTVTSNQNYLIKAMGPNGERSVGLLYYIEGGIAEISKVERIHSADSNLVKIVKRENHGEFWGKFDADEFDQILVTIKNVGDAVLSLEEEDVNAGGVHLHYPSGAFAPLIEDVGTLFPWHSFASITVLNQTREPCNSNTILPSGSECVLPLKIHDANGKWHQRIFKQGGTDEIPLFKVGANDAVLETNIGLEVYNGQDVGTIEVSAVESEIFVKHVNHPTFLYHKINNLEETQSFKNSEWMSSILFSDITPTFVDSTVAGIDEDFLDINNVTKFLKWGATLVAKGNMPISVNGLKMKFSSLSSSLMSTVQIYGSAAPFSISAGSFSCSSLTGSLFGSDTTMAADGTIAFSPTKDFATNEVLDLDSAVVDSSTLGMRIPYQCLYDFLNKGASASLSIDYNNGKFNDKRRIEIQFSAPALE